jgi:hypothetical protein
MYRLPLALANYINIIQLKLPLALANGQEMQITMGFSPKTFKKQNYVVCKNLGTFSL